ncbi:hypothetical protein MOF32_30125 [Priestia megaterium]|uniref:hypothetical protein n=1 Tax=Priestia megaterium TaxID=1404 RepID=UPI002280C016|nr:hypothetical protein [Priestia megaterium]MCY9019375.1 hypothetical protein [Priestia megaterium]MCY9027132.1 hypothetical protein [Priestia megaterium]
MSYKQYWGNIHEQSDKLQKLLSSYWHQYSDFGNWQFWVVLASLVLPLVLLYFTADRTRIFEVFFFGYTVHVLWAYTDIALGRTGYLTHTFFLTSQLPNATNITASILPVAFLLLYQYCTNHQKNFYLYTILLSAVFSFGLAPLEHYFGFIDSGKGMSLYYIFLIDIGITLVAYWFTRLLVKTKAAVYRKTEKER